MKNNIFWMLQIDNKITIKNKNKQVIFLTNIVIFLFLKFQTVIFFSNVVIQKNCS